MLENKKTKKLTPDEALLEAEKNLKNGNNSEAEKICQLILSSDPNHIKTHHVLGGLMMLSGRLKLAEKHFRLALEGDPTNGFTIANLATVLFHQGHPEEAISLYLRAIDLKADVAGIYDLLGQAYLAIGEGEKALDAFDKALVSDPSYKKARENLAKTHIEQGNKNKGLAHFNKLIHEGEDNFDALMTLGHFYLESDFPGKSTQYFEKARKISPKNLNVNLILAKAYNSCGLHQLALEHLEYVLMLRPEYAQGYSDQASIQENLGEFEKAEKNIKTCLALQPESPYALYLLTLIHTLPMDGPEAKSLNKIINSDNSNPAKILSYFSLAKIAQDNHQYDETMEHYIAGNTLRRNTEAQDGVTFDRERYLNQIERIIKTFDRKFFDERLDYGETTQQPVFIGGMPRSGTTLTEQIIASHPKASGAGELLDIPLTSQFIIKLTGSENRFPENTADLSKENVTTLSKRYLKTLENFSQDATKITNKLPGNFMFIGLIRLLFPEAPLIHCRRNPMDNCFSCFTTNFAKSHHYSLDLADLGFYWKQYERIMEHWDKVFPGEILHLDYETTVEAPEASAKKIIEHCGLTWDPVCLEFHKTKRPIMTASKRQVRQPIYKTSVERWRPYEKHLQPLMKELGITG
ncbi:MAG: sulfotransferase [Rhodospirillales bacterium]|nr:sulfotransferase [Rhodospirillales bacterium]